ncbi:aldo/keto reductase [Microbacterium sp. bgisy207]|uniref:aldo/keto reductase n=1 Tax=Microbacterium sp. bgisy207 TaxID=3413800 RepID=UPI003EB9924E
MTAHEQTTRPLLRGHRIPRVGMGTWPLVGDECAAMVEKAVDLGYRLFDTAEKYGNEDAVGAGLRASGIPRSEVFITSKFNKENHSVDGVKRAYDSALEAIGVDYLDLYLIHWPVPALDRYVDAWRGLVQLQEQGLVKAIGVSNFTVHHIDRIVEATGVFPDVDQIQLSVDIARVEQREYHRAHGIQTEAWSPLGRGGPLLSDPVVGRIAAGHGKSPAQVLLRWHLDEEIVPVPRAMTHEQLAQNIDIFDFTLTPEELALLGSFDRGERAARDPDDPANGH